MKKLLLLLIIAGFFIAPAIQAQTYVSGGIYSNTTWYKANSPYIITDTVVVFPGVTLTIQPGVTVKFDNNIGLEIRQATLIAQGTVTDSITFMSNSVSPSNSSWSGIYFNMCTNTVHLSYINYQNSANGIYNNDWNGSITITDSITIKHCKFYDNTNAVIYYYLSMDSSVVSNNNYGIFTLGNTIVDSCAFINNSQLGLKAKLANIETVSNCNFINNTQGADLSGYCNLYNCNILNNTDIGIANVGTIENCIIKNNNIGVESTNLIKNCIVSKNHIGIYLWWFGDVINCTVDSNSIYGIRNGNSISNCEIKFNHVGIYGETNDGPKQCTKNIIDSNIIGIKLLYTQCNVYCNRICNNSSYDLYDSIVGGSNMSVPNNYWFTSDSSSTRAVIYDGYDNPHLTLVYFMPIDTLLCYLTTGASEVIKPLIINVLIFPNPASNHLEIETSQKAEIEIQNIEEQVLRSMNINDNHTTIDISGFAKGMYFVKANTEKGITVKKFVKE
jgi:hypothetical protein